MAKTPERRAHAGGLLSNPHASLPLFAQDATLRDFGRGISVPTLSPTTRAVQLGIDGADDAHRHLAQHAPGFVLTALGDALLSLRGREFSSDDVRRLAGPTVNAWLTAEPERVNCFSGWWMKATRRHKLIRCGSVQSTREDARGRWIAVWRFPA